MSELVEIQDVRNKLYPPGPSLRTVREDMINKGLAIKAGRKYYTTEEKASEYIRIKTGRRKCRTLQNQNSNRTRGVKDGSRGGLSQRGGQTELSPDDQVNSALEQLRSAKHKLSATG